MVVREDRALALKPENVTFADAAAVPAPSRTQWPAINEADDSYRRVSVTGRFVPDGATRIYIVSDNNKSAQQRTLLLAFDIVEAPAN